MGLERITTHSLEWEGTQTLGRERHAHRWPSMVRGAMLARPTRRATYHRSLGSGELIPQNERKLRRSGVGPKAQTGAWPAQIRARSCARNPTLRDFRKNAEHSMCELTTGWILEKCPKSSVCTYHNVDFRKNAEHVMCDLTTEWILESALSFGMCTYTVYIFW